MSNWTNDEVFRARSLRLATIQNLYIDGYLTEAQAKELLAGPLDPDDPTTVVDDSDQLKVREEPQP